MDDSISTLVSPIFRSIPQRKIWKRLLARYHILNPVLVVLMALAPTCKILTSTFRATIEQKTYMIWVTFQCLTQSEITITCTARHWKNNFPTILTGFSTAMLAKQRRNNSTQEGYYRVLRVICQNEPEMEEDFKTLFVQNLHGLQQSNICMTLGVLHKA